MGAQPLFRANNNIIKWLGLRCALQFCLALSLLNPQDGVVRVGVDGLRVQTPLPTKRQSMHNGQEFPDVVRAINGTKVEHPRTSRQINALVLHRAGITRAGGVDSPCVGSYFCGLQKDRVVVGWNHRLFCWGGLGLPRFPRIS